MIHMKCHFFTAILCVALGFSLNVNAQLADVNRTAQSKMVKVYGSGGISGLQPYQSGFFVASNGLVVTTWSHVLDGETTIVTSDGRRYLAEFVAMDANLEIALLKINSTNERFFSSDQILKKPYIGQRVLSLSNLFGIAVGKEQQSLMRGTVSAVANLDAKLGNFDSAYSGEVIVVDLIANNLGAAGGVLLSSDGKLIGLLGKELRDKATRTWLNYCLPAATVFESIERLKAGKPVARKAADPAASFQLSLVGIELVPNVLQHTRPFIDEVIKDSVAEKNGVLLDDLVLFINGKPVRSIREVANELSMVDRDSTVTIVFKRGDKIFKKRLSRLDGR